MWHSFGACKDCDTKEFVADLRFSGITPHVAQSTGRSGRTEIDGRLLAIRVAPIRSTSESARNKCLAIPSWMPDTTSSTPEAEIRRERYSGWMRWPTTGFGSEISEPAGGNCMRASIKGPMALQTKTEVGQSCLEAVHVCRSGSFKLIDAVLMTITNRPKKTGFPSFSAAS